MQCILKEDGNIVLLHQGEIGNKLRRLIKFIIYKVMKYRKILMKYYVYFIFSLVKI